jgi:hypothetical protein
MPVRPTAAQCRWRTTWLASRRQTPSRCIHDQVQPVGAGEVDDSHPGTRISFDRNRRTVADQGKPAPSLARSSDASVLTALMTAVEPQQPGCLPHSDTAAAPGDRFPQRQALVLSHCSQGLPSAPFSVPHLGIPFPKRGQYRDRQRFKPAFPVGPFFAQYRPGIQR